MPWMIVLAAYLAIGFPLVFVGPAARCRLREQVKQEWRPGQPSFRLKIVSYSIALGTFVFWPLFTIWGKRELQGWIAAIQIWHPNAVSFATFRQVEEHLPWFHQGRFRSQLSELGYVVTGFAKGPKGEDVAVTISALSVGTPFGLTQILSADISLWPDATREWLLGGGNAWTMPPPAREWFGNSTDAWHKALLHEAVPPLIQKWELKLKVEVRGYFLQRMKTKWGSCNHRAGHIRLNTELVRKPKDLLEYVIVHETVHLIEPTHSDRFIGILEKYYPTWREARAELNELPLTAEVWNE